MIGMLGSLLGARGGRMLGGMIGGRTGAMIGGMVGSMIGGRRVAGAVRNAGGLGALGNLFGGDDGDDRGQQALADADSLTEAQAEMLIKVMVNAAKSDGRVDQAEIDQIMGRIDDATPDEVEFLKRELNAPFVDPSALASGIPQDLAFEAYVVSATAIQVDTEAERSYLHTLGSGLGISAEDQQAIDRDLGVSR